MPQPTLLILARSKLGRFCWITSATFGNNNDINLFRKNFKTLETNRRKSTASSQADITHQQYSLFHQCLSSGHLPHKEEVNQRQVRSQPRLRSTMGLLRLSCPRRSPDEDACHHLDERGNHDNPGDHACHYVHDDQPQCQVAEVTTQDTQPGR